MEQNKQLIAVLTCL